MMTDGFLALAKSSDAVVAAVGDRFYAGVAPQEPGGTYATFQDISESSLDALDGTVNFYTARLQVNTWDSSYQVAKLAGQAIRDAVIDFADGFADGTKVHNIALDTFAMQFDYSTKKHGSRADYIVTFSNPISVS